MRQNTEDHEAAKVLEALELCVSPVSLKQIQMLTDCQSLQETIELLVETGRIIVSTHSVVATSGQTQDESRYQIGPLEEK